MRLPFSQSSAKHSIVTAFRKASLASAVLCYGKSVSPSICLSVSLFVCHTPALCQ